MNCHFKPKFPLDGYTCCHPSIEAFNDISLCVFHLLSDSEKRPDHPSRKLSAMLHHDHWPERIEREFYDLIARNEQNPDLEHHDFTGFWLPSISLRDFEFTKPVIFREAVFLEECVLSEADLSAGADFTRAVFRGQLDVYSARLGQTDFMQTRFEKAAEFYDSTLEDVSFSQAVIAGDFTLGNCSFADSVVEFTYVKFLKDTNVIFDSLNLSRVSFLETDLEKIDFRKSSWFSPPKQRWSTGRNALWDEFRPLDTLNDETRDYAAIAQNYRELVINCERKRDYEDAESFHMGEMEVRRQVAVSKCKTRLTRWLSKHLHPYGLYWHLSRYGTNYWVALFWLLFLVLSIFPFIFLFSGFEVLSATGGKVTQAIVYELRPNFAHVGRFLYDLCQAESFSLSVATFQRSRLFEATGKVSVLLLPIESVLVAIQSALLLFAVRRRFKR